MTLRNDLTAATTPFGMWARPSTYTGTSCGVNVTRSAQMLVLGHLYRHRAGANVSKWQKGSRFARVRARAILSRVISAVRALAAIGLTNETSLSATRIDHQLPQNLVPKDPKSAKRRGKQPSELSTIVAVDHQKYPFLAWSPGGNSMGRQHQRTSETHTVVPTSASEAFLSRHGDPADQASNPWTTRCSARSAGKQRSAAATSTAPSWDPITPSPQPPQPRG